jgi:hypothetical protein
MDNIETVNERLRPLTTYDDISSLNDDPENFKLQDTDKQGPFPFVPTQCLWVFSPQQPKEQSNGIAVVKGVGDTDSIVERVTSYYTAVAEAAVRNTTKYVIASPRFRPVQFDTEEELYTYIQDPEYNTNQTHPGICFGF